MRLRSPTKQPSGLRKVVFLLILVAGNKHRVEPTMPDLYSLKSSKIGPRKIGLVGNK